MRRMSLRALCTFLLLASLPVAQAAVPPVTHGRFHDIPVYMPEGTPRRVVVWFDGGNDAAHTTRRLEALRSHGALVARVDMDRLRRAVAADGGDCAFGAGDVENFSRFLQAYLQVPGYHLPLLGGDGSGAGLAYAVAAQAESRVFAGILTTDFVPGAVRETLVCGAGIHHGRLQPAPVNVPWLTARDAAGTTTDFVKQIPLAREFRRSRQGDDLPGLLAAAQVLGAQQGVSLAPPPQGLDGLPVVEVPTTKAGDTLAIFVSGDGGWAGLDKEVASALSDAGVAVVGVDSLRYFWTRRTPQGFARDLERIAAHYRTQWQRPRLVLIGFSQGADVLPAAINQLDPATRDSIALIGLMSVGRNADYEFHVSNWLGGGGDGLPIAPEIARLPAQRTLCLYGKEDDDALCPDLPAGGVRIVALPGDHHFKGDYAVLAKTLLAHVPPSPSKSSDP
jgi:type IV secretory pathway VirJ component